MPALQAPRTELNRESGLRVSMVLKCGFEDRGRGHLGPAQHGISRIANPQYVR